MKPENIQAMILTGILLSIVSLPLLVIYLTYESWLSPSDKAWLKIINLSPEYFAPGDRDIVSLPGAVKLGGAIASILLLFYGAGFISKLGQDMSNNWETVYFPKIKRGVIWGMVSVIASVFLVNLHPVGAVAAGITVGVIVTSVFES